MRALVVQLKTEAAEIQKLSSIESVEPNEDTSEVSSDDDLNIVTAQAESGANEEEVVESEDIESTPQEQAQETFEPEHEMAQGGADEISALKDGSYWQATVFRAKASIMWLMFILMFALTMLLPIFLLWYWCRLICDSWRLSHFGPSSG